MPEINLQELSLFDLQRLSEEIDDEIERRSVEAKKKAVAQMKELAASVGMSIEEVMTYSATKKAKGQPKYQNPEDPRQTWTGRGKRPQWIKTAIEQGRNLEEMRLQEAV
jgi:DNA-binding protein H-NS